MLNIKIGTMVDIEQIDIIPKLVEYGFETFSLIFKFDKDYDMPKTAEAVKRVLEGTGCGVSNLCVYNNALADEERGEKTRACWNMLIDAAGLFGTDIVAGFTGRVIGKPVPESIPKFKEVFASLAEKAGAKGVRLAFENCFKQGDWRSGDWNIACTPRAWEMMFDAVPHDNIGLQWEPCHQMLQLIDPIPQLRKWVKKVFCLHGKDANIAWDVVKEHGFKSETQFVWQRTPGFGDCNWKDIISILVLSGFSGVIDIEGHHDPVFRNELEYTGQVYSLNYLKQCRGGDYYVNPAP